VASRQPAHQEPYEILKQEIADGDYPVGTMLATEEKLCERFSASRYAVRTALASLETEGLILRKRGAGSRVVRLQPTEHQFKHRLGSREDLHVYTVSTIVEWEPGTLVQADARMARELGCDEMREWQTMQGVRYESTGEVLGTVDIFVDPEVGLPPGRTDFDNMAVFEWIEEHLGVRPITVSQDIRPKALTDYEARTVGEPFGTPALQLVRRYFDARGKIYLISNNTYRSSDFVLNLRFRLDAKVN